MDSTTLEKNELFGEITPIEIEESLQITDIKLSLQHQCRQAIRKHLIHLEPHIHLFHRIPKLALPPSVSHYLLYNISLDDESKEVCDENKETPDSENTDRSQGKEMEDKKEK